MTARSATFVSVACPGLVLTAASALMLAMAAGGRHPLWVRDPVNIAEAAALRDAATVMQRLRAGENPGDRRSVRAGVLFPGPVAVTPLEAAIAAKVPEIVGLLLDAGEAATAAEWTYARCLAAFVEDQETAALLERRRPASAAGGPVDCTGARAPW